MKYVSISVLLHHTLTCSSRIQLKQLGLFFNRLMPSFFELIVSESTTIYLQIRGLSNCIATTLKGTMRQNWRRIRLSGRKWLNRHIGIKQIKITANLIYMGSSWHLSPYSLYIYSLNYSILISLYNMNTLIVKILSIKIHVAHLSPSWI